MRRFLQTLLCLAGWMGVTAIHHPTSKHPARCPTAFGLQDIVFNLRGGEVIEGSTATDVDDLIRRAGSDQSLVVIDFSATW